MSRAPAVKRRKLSPQPGEGESRAERADSKKKSTKKFYDQASSWDLEQDYETRPRKGGKKDKENTRLPIKTADGMVQELEVPEEDDESDLAWLSEGESEPEEKPEKEKKPEKPMRQQIMEAKEELAKIALLLNEDPEENAAAFKTLAAIGQSKTTTIKKLALATQLAIYKDIIPGYRIRPLNEDDMETKVSKEVRKLRAYEQALVGGYQAYIKELAKLAQSGKGGWSRDGGPSLGSVAIACACTLLTSVPHFNFRGELLKILVGKLSTRKIDADFVKCRETIETLFRDDEDGTPSLDATALLTKMMKARGYRVDESVLNTFLHLRLLTEFSWKASTNHIDRPSKAEGGFDAAKNKSQRVFRTKKQRKIMKEQKIIEKEMVQADATVSHEERDRMQAETLKLVFVTYFRILKIRSPNLMGAVLEGLASYAHLINQDFFGDLLEALKDLVGHAETGDDLDMANDDETPADEYDEETKTSSVTSLRHSRISRRVRRGDHAQPHPRSPPLHHHRLRPPRGPRRRQGQNNPLPRPLLLHHPPLPHPPRPLAQPGPRAQLQVAAPSRPQRPAAEHQGQQSQRAHDHCAAAEVAIVGAGAQAGCARGAAASRGGVHEDAVYELVASAGEVGGGDDGAAGEAPFYIFNAAKDLSLENFPTPYAGAVRSWPVLGLPRRAFLGAAPFRGLRNSQDHVERAEHSGRDSSKRCENTAASQARGDKRCDD
ncbi:hypothetical protein V495_06415, partial [Pseudogymnoascus sp. VKM F-4514 (FW-929)]